MKSYKQFINEGRKRIGYKVMQVENGRLIAGADKRLTFPLKKGVISMRGNGIYLGMSASYVRDYYSGLADEEVLLTLEFDESDITTGNINDREPELSVKKAKIVAFDFIDND